jgi:DNA-binding NarL/FixJ family response regulator
VKAEKPKRRADSKTARQRILIVDDHPMMREGLAQLINHEPDLEVCGQAEKAGEAIECVTKLKPDIVLADISLPDRNGLELIKDLQSMRPGLPILVISMHDEALYAERVLRAGARGYVMKQEGGKRLMEAIREVLAGRISVSNKMSASLLELFSGRRSQSNRSPMEKLTDREFEVFQLIGQGRSTREIAAQLHLSVKTVEVHRLNAKTKLDLHSATELIRYAVRWVEAQGMSGV